MRRIFCSTALLVLMFASSVSAQPVTQQGRIKNFAAGQDRITISVEGKDVDVYVTPDTIVRGANNQDIADFKSKGLAAGTPVMFRTEQRGDRLVLIGLKLAGRATEQRPGGRQQGGPPAPPPRDAIGVKPLPELGGDKYKNESGGLYGEGKNEPPTQHQQAAAKAAEQIRPLDDSGQPSPEGKIALLAIGMSNTTQEFSMFKSLADRDPQKSPHVVLVDGAQGGKAAEQWVDPKSEIGAAVWATVDSRLKAASVTRQQVQVVWVKQALIQQGRFGEFPTHAKKLEGDLVSILQLAKRHFPNLQLAYLSSRIYAGYAGTALNPEPYAYEGAFSIRWLIDAQIKGDSRLNYDPQRGEVTAPVSLWGPYLWGDGVTPRKSDGLVWKREDFREDGTHPSDSGRKKVADMLTNFFHTDPYARVWYLAR